MLHTHKKKDHNVHFRQKVVVTVLLCSNEGLIVILSRDWALSRPG